MGECRVVYLLFSFFSLRGSLKEQAFALAWLSGILFARTTLVVVLDSCVTDGLLLLWFLKELIFWPFLKCLFIFKQEAT